MTPDHPATPAKGRESFSTLDGSPRSSQQLGELYRGPYRQQFPDPDERESLQNMVDCLKNGLSSADYRYHISLASIDNQPVAGRIADYFPDSNMAVVEYWFVHGEYQGKGIGGRLARYSNEQLLNTARRAGQETLAGIGSEVNDPLTYLSPSGRETPRKNLERLKLYVKSETLRVGDVDYRTAVLDLRYKQPPLSADQGGVEGLRLIFQVPDGVERLDGEVVKSFLHDYFKYAMRIEDPTQTQEYQQQARDIDKGLNVKLVPLRAYIEQVERLKQAEALARQKEEISKLAKRIHITFNSRTGRRMAYDYTVMFAKELWDQKAIEHYRKFDSILAIDQPFVGQGLTLNPENSIEAAINTLLERKFKRRAVEGPQCVEQTPGIGRRVGL